MAKTGRPPVPAAERFWPKVDKTAGSRGCWQVDGGAHDQTTKDVVVEYAGNLIVYHDVARGVRCWYSEPGAISCLPDAQLKPASSSAGPKPAPTGSAP